MDTSASRTRGSVLRGALPAAALALLMPTLAFAQAAPATPAAAAPTTTTAAPAAAEAPAAAATTETAAAGTVSSYTEEQAARGKPLYMDECSMCHGTTLGGSGETPALAGKGFRERWFIGTADNFYAYIHSAMPQQAPGSLDPQTYADISAYLMSRNKVPAGEAELPPDEAALANITLPPLVE